MRKNARARPAWGMLMMTSDRSKGNWAVRLTGPGLFVAAAWLALTLAALAYVAWFGSPYPFGDEWDLLSGTKNVEPLGPWLWRQHNEHRLPLPKLIHWALAQLTNHDARAGCYLTVFLLGGLSALLIRAVRQMRGHVDYADAAFPIVLLNWGHFENFLIGFQIGFALSVVLAIGWLLSALAFARRQGWGGLAGLCVCALLLPLCGAHGLAYAPPLAIWMIWFAVRSQKNQLPVRRSQSTMLFASAAGAVALVIAYFIGYQRPGDHPSSGGVVASLTVALEVLALQWGWVGRLTWPMSGAMSLLLLFGTATLLVLASARQPADRPAAFAVAAVIAGGLALALGIGWGRSGFGLFPRYALLAVPLTCVAYLTWARWSGRILGSLVPMTIFTVLCLFLTQHCRTGLAEGKIYAEQMAAFDRDLTAGLSPQELADRHRFVYPQPAVLAERLKLLSTPSRPAVPTR